MEKEILITTVKSLGKGWVRLNDCNELVDGSASRALSLKLKAEIYLLMRGINEAEIYDAKLAEKILDCLIY